MHLLYHVQKTLLHSTSSQPLALTCFLSSLPPCSQSLWGQRVIKVMTGKTKHSTEFFSTLTRYEFASTKKTEPFPAVFFLWDYVLFNLF